MPGGASRPGRAVVRLPTAPAWPRSARRSATDYEASGSPGGPSSGGGSGPASFATSGASSTTTTSSADGTAPPRRRRAGLRAARRAARRRALRPARRTPAAVPGQGRPRRRRRRRRPPRRRLQDRAARDLRRAVAPTTPTSGGRRLQLAVYGLAARAHRAEPDAAVHAEYWFVSAKGGFERAATPSPTRCSTGSPPPRRHRRGHRGRACSRPTPPTVSTATGSSAAPATPTASASPSCAGRGSAKRPTRRSPPTPSLAEPVDDVAGAPTRPTARRWLTPDGCADQPDRGPHRRRPRRDPVRRGRRRLGQDHRPRRPGPRPGHRRRRRARRRSPPSPSPRRPAPSCATASATPCRSGAGGGDAEAPRRCRAALDQLDGAAIGTLHSFAQRILAEHPIEAACRPGSRCSTRSPPASSSSGGGAPSARRCSPTPTSSAPCCVLFATGVGDNALDALAEAFDANWDLVDERVAARLRSRPTPAPRLAPALLDPRRPAASSGGVSPTAATCSASRSTHRRVRRPARDIDDEADLLDALDPAGIRRPRSSRGAPAGRGTGRDVDMVRPARARRGLSGRRRCGPPIGEACAPPPRPGHPPLHPRRRPGSAGPPAGSSSTTCWCWPAPCCATRTTAPRCGPASTTATGGCCSTSSRTPTPSRSSWPCASPPPTRRTRRAGTRAVGAGRGRARAPVRGRRPEAVDLPLPPGRHRLVPRRPASGSARTAGVVAADGQLPHGGTGRRVGQRTCSAG